MQLIVISPSTAFPHGARLATKLLDAGLNRLHLRKPTFGRAEMADYMARIPARHHARLVLHAHHTLVTELNLGGMHLTAEACNRLRGRPHLYPGQTLSTSFHALAEVQRHRRKYDYVFLSPVFTSISKQDYPVAFKLSDVHEALQQLRQRASYAPGWRWAASKPATCPPCGGLALRASLCWGLSGKAPTQ